MKHEKFQKIESLVYRQGDREKNHSIITKTFPKEVLYNLGSQMNDAAISIPSNIAEGSGRNSDKDYAHFIDISVGSSYELETQLLLTQDLKYGDARQIDEILGLLMEEQKMLMAFAISLRKKPSSSNKS